MHTYVKAKTTEGAPGWQAGYASTGPTAEHTVNALGPVFEKEEEAASFASFLNGGRWSPGELAGVLPPPEADPEIAAEKAREERRAAEKGGRKRPEGMDYPPEDDNVYGQKVHDDSSKERPQARDQDRIRPQPTDESPTAKAHAAKRKPDVKRTLPKGKKHK